jgi:hypothetical protein
MTFEEFLVKRKIDAAAFRQHNEPLFTDWQNRYAQMHPNSFFVSVKMVINDVRRQYHLAEVPAEVAIETAPVKKPVIRRARPETAAIPETIQPEILASKLTTESAAAGEKPASTGRPIRQRPVIKKAEPTSETEKPAPTGQSIRQRPVIEKAETPTAETEKPATPEISSETPLEVPKPAARPRPVIRRPSALASDAVEKPEEATPQEAITEPEAPAAKPARSRPVIKRPGTIAAEKPAEEKSAEKPENLQGDLATETPVIDTPKPARPRPIIRRPGAEAKPAENIAVENPEPEPEKSAENEANLKGENPAAEPEKPKPPRPRPIIRRPSKPDETDPESGQA